MLGCGRTLGLTLCLGLPGSKGLVPGCRSQGDQEAGSSQCSSLHRSAVHATTDKTVLTNQRLSSTAHQPSDFCVAPRLPPPPGTVPPQCRTGISPNEGAPPLPPPRPCPPRCSAYPAVPLAGISQYTRGVKAAAEAGAQCTTADTEAECGTNSKHSAFVHHLPHWCIGRAGCERGLSAAPSVGRTESWNRVPVLYG